MRIFYGIIDLAKRGKRKTYESSSIFKYYTYGQIVRLVWDSDGTVKWHAGNNSDYYIIPKDCYTQVSKEKYPEYYL